MSDLLVTLLRLNLAVAAAVALAMLLRLPARRLFGARIAYGLWSLVPLAALAMLLPARIVTVVQAEAPSGAPQVLPSIASMAGASPTLPPTEHGLRSLLAALGIAGAAASLLYLVWRQAQFGRAIREGRAGPAVIGVLRPRIVVPDDFAQRYTPREQLVVLAHERTHIARHDFAHQRRRGPVALRRLVQPAGPCAGPRPADRPGARLRRPGGGRPPQGAPRLCRGHAEDPARRPTPADRLLLARPVRSSVGPAHRAPVPQDAGLRSPPGWRGGGGAGGSGRRPVGLGCAPAAGRGRAGAPAGQRPPGRRARRTSLSRRRSPCAAPWRRGARLP